MCVFFGWGSIVLIIVLVMLGISILRFFGAKRAQVEYHAHQLGDALEEEAEERDHWTPPSRRKRVAHLRRWTRMLWHGGNLIWSLFWLIVGLLILLFIFFPSSCGGIA
ncbi:MAG: hypothetical protein COV59_05305 [Candidatus Magasanikbacteria bacterium CG11_big_fil_rev_8_21_14_0_20_39_34]|uniref:Uncharacterized protein n=1 Tax=Candidatus Magasanikbacteria bacterium CG11_big_fil_rev_8_21_14_0_20_39_34 TaxID=1974653 RepID=A0A2H0N3X4_9BACT|nr:MAG: hypothetical protein COV59_05305 [Candidatus Magasanikbacteria bacterium CG11_big_fil_rev_8_21_14_0_20_39_34]